MLARACSIPQYVSIYIFTQFCYLIYRLTPLNVAMIRAFYRSTTRVFSREGRYIRNSLRTSCSEYVSPSRLSSSSYTDGRMLNRYENELGDFGRSRASLPLKRELNNALFYPPVPSNDPLTKI